MLQGCPQLKGMQRLAPAQSREAPEEALAPRQRWWKNFTEPPLAPWAQPLEVGWEDGDPLLSSSSDLLHVIPREKPFLAVQPAFPPAGGIWEGDKKSGVVPAQQGEELGRAEAWYLPSGCQ